MNRWLAELWLLGAGVVAFALFAASALHVPWSRWIVVVALLVTIVTFSMEDRHSCLSQRKDRQECLSSIFIDLITALLALGYARYATLAPPAEGDFVTMWGLKAREYANAGGIAWAWLRNPFNDFAHVDYPPLVPLLFDAQTLLAGGWPGRWLGILYVGFGVATLLLVRWFLRDETEVPWLRALATLAFVAFAFSPWIGMAEAPLVAYGTAGLLFVRRGDVARGAVYLGLAANCKNEGLTLIVAAAVGLLAAGAWRSVARLWPAAAIAAPWLVTRSLLGLHGDLLAPGASARIAAHLHDLGAMFAAIAQSSHGRAVLWSGIVLALLAGAPRLVKRERFLGTAIVVQIGFFLAAYLVTPHDVAWHVQWSWERLVAQLGPAIVFLAMTCVLPRVEEVVRPSAR